MRESTVGNVGELRRVLRLGLQGLAAAEPDRIACVWTARRLWRWAPYAAVLGVDLGDLASLVGDLGEPFGRAYRDADARAAAVQEARERLAAALGRLI
jgi:hypothetical protein